MSNEFTGKRALVTGGTSGIGKGIADALEREGCSVLVTGLSRAECEASSLPATPLDVGSQSEVDSLIAGLGQLDILVNSAGMILRDAEFDIPGFARVIDVNLTGTMRLCTGCRPLLAKTEGCIVNIASMLSFFGGARVPAYSASKGGIAQLTKSLAIAWASAHIRVNAVAPGWITSNLTAALQQDPAGSAQIIARTPMNRWGTPQDIAGPVIFLCSQAAAFVTGIVLPVDGGYSIR
jgi:NAD(P)-dependent dehydrogenase (short-subunit alcohol dehydrogenase family)